MSGGRVWAVGDAVLTPTGTRGVVLSTAGLEGRVVVQYVTVPDWQPREGADPVPSKWAGTVTLRGHLLRPAPVAEPEHVAARRASRLQS